MTPQQQSNNNSYSSAAATPINLHVWRPKTANFFCEIMHSVGGDGDAEANNSKADGNPFKRCHKVLLSCCCCGGRRNLTNFSSHSAKCCCCCRRKSQITINPDLKAIAKAADNLVNSIEEKVHKVILQLLLPIGFKEIALAFVCKNNLKEAAFAFAKWGSSRPPRGRDKLNFTLHDVAVSACSTISLLRRRRRRRFLANGQS